MSLKRIGGIGLDRLIWKVVIGTAEIEQDKDRINNGGIIMSNEEYNVDQAMEYIYQKVRDSGKYAELGEEMLRNLIQDMIDLEEGYMEEAGILLEEEDEMEEEAIYDEEDAFHYIFDELRNKKAYRKIPEEILEELVDDYLEYNYEYMESIGLID